MRIAIIGAGISGIAFAQVLARFCHTCVLFEQADSIGGIWALAYPGVRLQNSREQYHLADFPWPSPPDRHPTAVQILNYLQAAAAHFQLDVRLGRSVVAMREQPSGWVLDIMHRGRLETLEFDYTIIAIGQYAENKLRPAWPGAADFMGSIVTEREVRSPNIFAGKRVAVVGFGKSAVDMAALAAPHAQSVAHVFRTPRWLIPFKLLGLHYTHLLFARMSTVYMPSWIHVGRIERTLHEYAAPLVHGFWKLIGQLIARHIRRHAQGRDPLAVARLARVIPSHDFVSDLRSATAMAPPDYYSMIARGTIEPYCGDVAGYGASSLRLLDGSHIDVDLVVQAVGSSSPTFPFLPAKYRDLLEADDDGAQLYRHLLHPNIPRLAFAGYNHGFMHVPAAEVGALWLAALLRGDLVLPAQESQLRCMANVAAWKRAHIQFEPSRACAVSTRFQQYIDGLLTDLGMSPYRKLPNVFAECLARYGASDYTGMVDTYLARGPAVPRAVRSFET